MRYCKSTIFQANHNGSPTLPELNSVVCDTAKVRFFKQITTTYHLKDQTDRLFAILQKYDFSSKSQLFLFVFFRYSVVCDTAKVRFFKQITTMQLVALYIRALFAILQKYDFSSKSQLIRLLLTINVVVCDTAKVRFFKQITTDKGLDVITMGCLRYCKSTIFQANHNVVPILVNSVLVVCDTAKVRFFKQITTKTTSSKHSTMLFAILQKYDFSSKSQQKYEKCDELAVVCDTAKVRFFKQITTYSGVEVANDMLFAILQKYDFSSKSQLDRIDIIFSYSCLRYCKSTIFQANHNRNNGGHCQL